MEQPQRIEEPLMVQRNGEAKDEMNLAEFPLCALAHRLKPEVKTLRFEDRVWDKSRGEWISRQLTITGSDAYGLPTELDDEVLLGLIQLTRHRGFADRKVPFSRHELIRLLGWRDESKSYQRIEASLNRWTGVTLFYNKAWWNKERKCWMDEKFHILDNVWLCHRHEPAPDTGLPTRGTPISAFVWNEVVFRSFSQGNLKSIDFDFFLSLRSAVAKRLYRFLDKRFWHCDRWEMDLRELCCEHIGLSRNYDIANLKRKLLRGVQELNERGFLRPMERQEQFHKLRAGQWKVTFERLSPKKLQRNENTNRNTSPLAQELIDRGITASTAVQTVSRFPEERIQRHIKAFDWVMKSRDAKPPRNPPGFLMTSIQQDFATPVGGVAEPPLPTRNGSSVAGQNNSPMVKVARPQPHEAAINAYLENLSAEERAQLERDALPAATPLQRRFLDGGGTLGAATKDCLLQAAAFRAIEARRLSSIPAKILPAELGN